jgi:hypothetical protein
LARPAAPRASNPKKALGSFHASRFSRRHPSGSHRAFRHSRGDLHRPIIANVVAQILLSATTFVVVCLCVNELRWPPADIGLSPPNWGTPLLAIALDLSGIVAPRLRGRASFR